MLQALPLELWGRLLHNLGPRPAAALRCAAAEPRTLADAAGRRLLAERLSALSLPEVPPREAWLLLWQARPGARAAEAAAVALFAAENGCLGCLLATAAERGAEALLDFADGDGVTLLHAAAAAGAASVCEGLCGLAAAAGAEVHRGALARATVGRQRTPLHCAAARGDAVTISALLAGVPSLVAQELLAALDRRGRPPALLALVEGHEEVAHGLVDAVITFLGPAREAGTALLVHACDTGSLVLVAALLERGADVNCERPSDGVFPILAASTNGNLAMLRLLLRQPGVQVDRADSTGRSALHRACQLGQAAVVDELLAGGAAADREASGGRTPLYLAAERGSVECVEVLLRDGGLPALAAFHETSRLTTPLSVAQRRGCTRIVELLLAFVSSFQRAPGPGPRGARAASARRRDPRVPPAPRGAGSRSLSPASPRQRSLALAAAARESLHDAAERGKLEEERRQQRARTPRRTPEAQQAAMLRLHGLPRPPASPATARGPRSPTPRGRHGGSTPRGRRPPCLPGAAGGA